MTLTREPFGSAPDGIGVEVFTIANDAGYQIRCMSYGATLISVKTPGRDGSVREITLGYDSLDQYVAGHPFFGSSVGRVCNRIGGAQFTLDGREYVLPANAGPNMLHGGSSGFDKKVWETEAFQSDAQAGVVFHRVSPDGEEGFPGTLDVTITISLTDRNELVFEYRAETDQPTPVNLTNHAYWNLAGAPDLTGDAGTGPGGAIGTHELTLHCDRLLDVDAESIPTGKITSVAGTPFDFTKPKEIGADIALTEYGYDHCYLLTEPAAPGGEAVPVALVREPGSGRQMEVRTTLPAVQLYSGNKLEGTRSRADEPHHAHNAFCLETQHYVDAVNHPNFPSIILRPGETFEHRTVHTFSVIE